MFSIKRLVCVLGLSLYSLWYVMGHKECSNWPSETSSITFRNDLLNPDNKTWNDEMLKQTGPPDDTAFDNLLPREDFDWRRMYDKLMKNGRNITNVQEKFLKEMSLHNVRLDPNSKHGRAQQTNLEYLLMLDVDSLVWSFRKTAGLPTPGTNYTSWEGYDQELRGHFVGHYMSATAQMWASTYNDTLKQKMSAVVSALSDCQNKIGTGYLSAFPTELFDRVETIKSVWAPYYTIHKIMAGLLDQHMLADNPQALKMVTWMADYFFGRVQNVIAKYSLDRHWRSLNTEFGGMNEVFYKLYALTQNRKYFVLGHLFDKPCFLGSLAIKVDDISGLHANTHIAILIGTQLRYEVTGDPLYKEIGTYFMDIVNASHSYATGGTSVHEFWLEADRLADTLVKDNEESCTTYNMLKVSRHLFRWTKEMAYADYYERALTNGVLSIQRGTEPGVMIYFLPLDRGSSKAISQWGWGTPFGSFWCCYGTGTESFSKLGDSIYFEENGQNLGLYIIQFISSTLNWKNGGISLNMKVQEPVTSWDPHFQVNLTVLPNEESPANSLTLHLRVPFWTSLNGAKALLNGQALSLPNPGSFLSIKRKWNPGDQITLELPIKLRIEPIKDDRPKYASVQAILYGPYLLAGLSGGDWDIKAMPNASLSDWITPIPATYKSQLISLSQQTEKSNLVLSSFNDMITMQNSPLPGTNASLHATFRLILKDANSSAFSQPKDVIGKSIMLEPIHLPGKVVSYSGNDQGFVVSDPSLDGRSSIFNLVAGLDGRPKTISLELESQKGCFVYGDKGSNVKLSCNSNSTSDVTFKQMTSFVMESGMSSYDPISFVAKGLRRNFLLTPLLSLRDEFYTVYFNIQP